MQKTDRYIAEDLWRLAITAVITITSLTGLVLSERNRSFATTVINNHDQTSPVETGLEVPEQAIPLEQTELPNSGQAAATVPAE